ncbi:MATE family efflux transporter [Allocoleopsis franciscana]|uniref:Probable multidrug resistance protein NorM n=1 Tax=Allocoleopsis franciscana PCC 7113 TaxID=1173027 RepID=K9WNC4_9CYAN|nr:MATE family efflux transporter [Allocoleopsis franciscana]AFZ21306.1 putative efflux protein, MATE family [Allocoleopsis franciscana PCC 7113]
MEFNSEFRINNYELERSDLTSISIPTLRTEVKEFLHLAVPLASAQVAQSLVGFVDTVMMGHLGWETLAAGGLASITFTTLLQTATGMVMGVSPLVAKAYGAGDKLRIKQVVRQGLWLSLVLAVPMMLLIGHLDKLMLQLGQVSATVTLADTYLDIMLWAMFPVLGFAVLRGLVSGVSQARPIMAIVIGGTLFNIVGNYILGYGKLGFPKLGLTGLALASTATFWGMFLALALYILIHPQLKSLRIFQTIDWLKPSLIRELLWIGAPIGISAALEFGQVNAVTYMMGTLGTDVLAAHQIVFQTGLINFMLPLGMSYAATVRVGQWLGKQNLEGVQKAGYVSMFFGGGVMVLMAITLITFSRQVIGLYLDVNDLANASIVAIAMPMFTVVAVQLIFEGVQRTAYGALQGLQDTRVPMLLGFLAFWGAGLLSSYMLGYSFNLGGMGLLIGEVMGIATAAGFFIWRFRQLISKYTTFDC